MAEQADELKKMSTVAADLQLANELRTKAVKVIGELGTHQALLALLDLVANEKLTKKEREFALKQAETIIKKVKA